MAATAMPSAADPARTFDEALGERLIAAGKLEQKPLEIAGKLDVHARARGGDHAFWLVNTGA